MMLDPPRAESTHKKDIGKNERILLSILTGQHDYPVFSIPTGVQRYGVHWKVRVRDLLTGMLTATAVLVDHCCSVAIDRHAYLDKPVLSANLA